MPGSTARAAYTCAWTLTAHVAAHCSGVASSPAPVPMPALEHIRPMGPSSEIAASSISTTCASSPTLVRVTTVGQSSRKQDALDEVAKEIREAHPGVGVLPKAAHVADEDAARACVEAAVAEFGGVDVLVNNAATSPYFGPLVDLDAARANKTV